MKNTKCAPAIWKKLSPVERKIWDMCYKMFLIPEYNLGISREANKTLAHNHACQVAWAYREITNGAIRKIN